MAVEALHRMSPDEYRRLIEAGVFDEDARIELIDGLLVDMSPKTRAHENAVAWLNRHFVLNVAGDRFEVRVGAPLTIGMSEPEPDVAVIPYSAPRPHHPATAALVVEVAVSSLTRDLTDKPPIYAAAGVPVYWAIDLDGQRAVAHSSPLENRYAQIDVFDRDGVLHADELGLEVSLPELFAAAARQQLSCRGDGMSRQLAVIGAHSSCGANVKPRLDALTSRELLDLWGPGTRRRWVQTSVGS